MRRLLKGCGVLLAVLIVISCVGALASMFLSPDTAAELDEPVPTSGAADESAATVLVEPTATDEPESVATSAPTDTPSPTDTPAPTSAPPPTNTPRPTATPSPTEDVSAQALAGYREWVHEMSSNYTMALDLFGEQNIEAGENPALTFTDEWRQQMILILVLFNITSQEILEYEQESTVPPAAITFHEGWKEVARLMQQFVDAYTEGIDNIDAGKIAESTSLLQQAIDKMGTLPVDDILP